MISVSSAFAAANAQLEKQPVYLLEIQGYDRAFTDFGVGLGTFASLPANPVLQHAELSNGGSFTPWPGSVTLPNATPAGNVLFAFLSYGDIVLAGLNISDTAGNTWTQLHLGTGITGAGMGVWYCIANGSSAGNVVTFNSPGGGTRGSCSFFVAEVSASYSGFSSVYAEGLGPTATASVGGNTLTLLNVVNVSSSWELYMVALAAASGAHAEINLGFLVATSPHIDSSQFVAGYLSQADLVIGGSATAYDWLVSIDDLKLTISDTDGSSDMADLVFNVQDVQQQLTADLASFVFEGKECRLLHGFVGMALVDYAPMFRGVINTVDSDNDNLEYKFTVSSFNLKKLTAKIFILGDDGFTTADKHPHTINAHPLDVLVTALQQAGVAAADIDTTKIYFYRDNAFNGSLFQFTLTSAPTAKDFIENELMKPLGMYVWENNLGLVSVNSFYPAMSGSGGYTPPTPPVDTLDVDATTLIPLAQQAPMINQIATKFDDDGTGSSKFQSENIETYSASVQKYGMTDAHTIESQGLRSSFQGYLISTFVSFLIFLRYGLKNLFFDPVPCLWSHCVLEPGDLIALTEPYVPDRVAGVLGITLQTFEVMDRTWKFMDGIVEVKLLAIDLSKFKQFLITPNGEANYAADSPTNQAKYMYLSDAAGKYSTGAAGNTVG